ncbi:hypothetical protein KP79_PYT22250 [Mizuhopecten yessoensis]|uniref:Uncharacterized protein n=1 Tax=Mizuhopecten yessoensis TaxID=6573 RepID=A0A210QDK5_MIZYE|nr:hypothetical protein KP79_PYT22250 [Mizuhopecten yessoensis]
MVYGVVFVMVLAVAFAINGQQDYKYDTILSEVSALKKFTFNMNVEFGRLRQQHEEMREELRAFRSRHNSIGTHSLEGGDSPPQDKKDDGKIIVLNTRTAGQAVNTSFQTHWNDSQVSASQVANGNSSLQSLKGDKGTTGTTVPKGDTGTTGPTGLKGEMVQKGTKEIYALQD